MRCGTSWACSVVALRPISRCPGTRGRVVAVLLTLMRWLRGPLILVLSLLVGFEGFYAWRVWELRQGELAATAFMAGRLERLRARDPQARLEQRWVPYDDIAPALKRAVVAAEDAKFSRHGGFDWEGIRRAVEKNLAEGEVVAGGSTITQQLAKNLFLSGERSFLRKGQEAVLTLMIEAMLDKRRILELYLNLIEWGEAVYGAEAAARHYFGIPAARLGSVQAARLAAMIPRPRYYQRHGVTPALLQRAAAIGRSMPQVELPQ